LTPKQERFVAEFIISGNATQAAISAGYAPKWAGVNADRLTKHDEIASAIEASRKKALERSELTRERIILEIRRIALSDPRRLYDPATKRLKHVLDLDDDAAAAVYSPDTKIRNLAAGDGVQDSIEAIKTWDKPKALEQLVRIFGLNAAEKVEVTMVGEKLKAARARLANR
jgi:phage terminase small subunit